MSGSNAENRTLRQKLYEAAPGREEKVDELLTSSVRGSDAIEGIRFPQADAPSSTDDPQSSSRG
jgi:hypothetical protein